VSILDRVRRDDAGFTLPELLVAVAVAAIVMPAVSMVLVTSFKTTTGTTERLAASNAAEMTSSWFIADVQSADEYGQTDVASCKSPGTHLLFTASRTNGTDAVVTGYATLDSGGERSLIRYRCVNGTAEPTVTVAYDLDQAALPGLVCEPTVAGKCASTTTHVALAVTVNGGVDASPATTETSDDTDYTFNLNGTRRTS